MTVLSALVACIATPAGIGLAERAAGLALYLGAAALCGLTAMTMKRCFDRRAGWNARTRSSAGYHRRRRFWFAAGIGLLAAGVSVELGMLNRLIDVGRSLASQQGWYHNRWLAQGIIAGLVLVVVAALIVLAARRRAGWYPRDRLAAASLGALLGFIAVRGLSQHHLEVLLSAELLHIALGRWMELAMLSMLCSAATWTMHCRRPDTRAAQRLSLNTR